MPAVAQRIPLGIPRLGGDGQPLTADAAELRRYGHHRRLVLHHALLQRPPVDGKGERLLRWQQALLYQCLATALDGGAAGLAGGGQVDVELVHDATGRSVIGQPEALQTIAGLHLQLAVIDGQGVAVIRIGEAVGAVQCRIDVAAQGSLRIVIAHQSGHRHAELLGLARNPGIDGGDLHPALAIRGEALLEAPVHHNFLAVDKEATVVTGPVIDGQTAPTVVRRGNRHPDITGPATIPHGDPDQAVIRQQGTQSGLAQGIHGGIDLLDPLDCVLIRLHHGRRTVPLAKAGGRVGIEHCLALQKTLDDGGRIGGIEGETVGAGERAAARHRIVAKLAAIERWLALAIQTGILIGAGRREVGDETVFVTVPAPTGVELIGTAMNRAAETIYIVAKAEVVTHLVAELVAQRIIQRDDATATGTTVHLNPIGILAATVVRRQLGNNEWMAPLPFTGTTVDAVVGIVDAVGDKLLADALTHGAAMPAPFARVKVGQQGAVGQHHFRQGERCILTDNHPAGRNGLEVFAMGLLVIGKDKAIPWCGEHADVDGVQQQLAGGADLDITQFTTEIALTNGEGQSGLDPLGRQLAAPGIRCIGDAVVLQLPLAEPLPIGKLELQGLATGDGHLSLAIEGRRVITGAGADPHHLALQLRAHGQVDIPNPAAVGGLDLHQRAPGQPILEEGAALVAQFGQISTAADDGSAAALRDEAHSAFGNPREVVDRLGQRRWR